MLKSNPKPVTSYLVAIGWLLYIFGFVPRQGVFSFDQVAMFLGFESIG